MELSGSINTRSAGVASLNVAKAALESDGASAGPQRACHFSVGVRGISQGELADQVRIVEAIAFPVPQRWTETKFDEAFAVGCQMAAYQSMPGVIHGYVLFHMTPGKQVEIVRIAVREWAQRNGIASLLLDWCKKGADAVRAEKLVCDVPETNTAMHLLLKKNGFICNKTFTDRGGEDDGLFYRFVFDMDDSCSSVVS